MASSVFTLHDIVKNFSNLQNSTVQAYIKRHKHTWPKAGHGKYVGDKEALIAFFAQKSKYGYGEPYVPPESIATQVTVEAPPDFKAMAAENARLYKELQAAQDWNKTVVETIVNAVASRPRPEPNFVKPRKSKGWPASFVLQIGDAHGHLGEHIDAIMTKSEKIIRDTGCGTIEEIAVSFGGDDQDGTNVYPGHAFMATKDNVTQMVEVGEDKIRLLEWAATLCKKVTAKQANGNHASGGMKRGGPPHPQDNWDFASGKYAERVTRDWVDWEFLGKGELFLQTKIGGMTVMVAHGDYIRSHFKTPHYGIDYWTMASAEYVKEEWKNDPRLVLLHHHHRLFLTYQGKAAVSMPGTLQPANDYVQSLGAQTSPLSQVLITIKGGANPCVHGWHPIFVEV